MLRDDAPSVHDLGTDAGITFHIGPWEYRARMSQGSLSTNGSSVDVWTSRADREILVNPECPPAARFEALLNGVCGAWLMHFESPTGICSLRDFVASVCAQAIADMVAAGLFSDPHKLLAGDPLKLPAGA